MNEGNRSGTIGMWEVCRREIEAAENQVYIAANGERCSGGWPLLRSRFGLAIASSVDRMENKPPRICHKIRHRKEVPPRT